MLPLLGMSGLAKGYDFYQSSSIIALLIWLNLIATILATLCFDSLVNVLSAQRQARQEDSCLMHRFDIFNEPTPLAA